MSQPESDAISNEDSWNCGSGNWVTHGHFCLDALRWKMFKNCNQGGGKSFPFNCSFSPADENKADKLPLQLPSGRSRRPEIQRTLAVLLEEATRKPDKPSRLAWEQLSLVGK